MKPCHKAVFLFLLFAIGMSLVVSAFHLMRTFFPILDGITLIVMFIYVCVL